MSEPAVRLLLDIYCFTPYQGLASAPPVILSIYLSLSSQLGTGVQLVLVLISDACTRSIQGTQGQDFHFPLLHRPQIHFMNQVGNKRVT
jgi:hypothetical protein